MASATRRPLASGALLAGALLFLPASWTQAGAQAGAQESPIAGTLPLTHAPIAGLDSHTLVLGQFERTQDLISPDGGTAVKTTFQSVHTGIFGGDALTILGPGGVAIHRLVGFNTQQGTIEMWVKPGDTTSQRQYLFSLQGRRSLNGDAYSDLIVGETNTTPSENDTTIYFGTPGGLDIFNPAHVLTMTPRGLGVADFDGDGHMDLVISNNQADTLPSPLNQTPGEIHVHAGPFGGGQYRSVPDAVYEVDEPQGLVVADFDQQFGPDVAVASYRTVSPAVIGFTNDNTGALQLSFASLGIEHVTSAEGLAVDDVDGDGVLDVLYGSFSSQPSYLLIGDVTGGIYTFSDALKSSRSNQTLGVSIADVTGDGWPDIVLAQPLFDNGPMEIPGSIAIHINDGKGGFSSTADIRIMSPRPFTLTAVKDINSDGHLDIITANWRFGGTTTPASTAYLGPFAPGPPGPPPRLEFLVDDAVALAMGDLDGDGLDDLFMHSATATASPVFLLDVNGVSKAGVDGMGRNLPSGTLPTLPTVGNSAGEGAGAMVVQVGGTSTYGSHLDRSNSFELYVESNEIFFVVTDRTGVEHIASAPVPAQSDLDSQSGFHHVQAQWRGADGLVELRVGHPDGPGNTFAGSGILPFEVDAVSPVFRLGSEFQNQFRAAGWQIDDVRISDVVRSEQDADHDGLQDDWDNCPLLYNPAQADWNDDGIGDGCRTCQPDLGVPGAGTFTLNLCGQPLHTGAVALLTVSGAPPDVPVLLLSGPIAVPRPFRGGMLVPSPVRGVTVLRSDAFGSLERLVHGGTHGAGPQTVILQAVAPDPGRAGGLALSNALAVERLP